MKPKRRESKAMGCAISEIELAVPRYTLALRVREGATH
jgi:hypothetical protein